MQRSLSALFWSMLVLTLVALCGLAFDPRLVTGAPAFLKPLKFAVSTALYAVSFGWLLRFIEGHDRLRRRLGNLTAAVLFLELGLIFLQAARGVGSHFNVSTLFDGLVFRSMGIAIVVLWGCQIAAAVLLLRQRFPDPALAWSLRLGMAITVLGGAVGFVMAARMGHTVGAPDGGPGLPITNWSTQHGDLRAAHFLGLHALQALPLFAWLTGRARALSPPRRAQLVVAFGLSYAALLLLLVLQALRGQPLTALDRPALVALSVWAGATLALVGRALFSGGAPALEAA